MESIAVTLQLLGSVRIEADWDGYNIHYPNSPIADRIYELYCRFNSKVDPIDGLQWSLLLVGPDGVSRDFLTNSEDGPKIRKWIDDAMALGLGGQSDKCENCEEVPPTTSHKCTAEVSCGTHSVCEDCREFLTQRWTCPMCGRD